MELFEVIRREHFLHKKGIRQIARELGIHRRVVRQALGNSVPPKRKRARRKAPVLTEGLREVIDGWLSSDRKAPRKQRHTARRIYARLKAEHAYRGAESTVRVYVGQRRRELGVVEGAFVPQVHCPGEEAEVDWYEAMVVFPWGTERVQIFQMRACYSGREFHQAFSHATQQAFLEAHVAAFRYFGGVFKRVRYDNLSAAVQRVLRGRHREQTERFIALRSHYLFEAEFCRPGISGAHEKGGVEGAVGRFRRNHLVPVPEAASYEAFNEALLNYCAEDDQRRIGERERCVAEEWSQEARELLALPQEPFATAEVSVVRVNSKGLICVRTNRYSVPIGLVGQALEVRLQARRVEVVHRGAVVAEHERHYGQHGVRVQLDHYLELLRLKPGALKGSLALQQAREAGRWPAVYDRLWSELCSRWGEREGTRELVEVMLLHRQAQAPQVQEAVEQALEVGCCDYGSIQVLLRQRQGQPPQPAPLTELSDPLLRYERPAGDVRSYDALLKGSGRVH